MPENNPSLLLFGDETADRHAALEAVIDYSSTSVEVRNYLNNSLFALKDEAERFFPGELAEVESFEGIVELADLPLGSNGVQDVVGAVIVSITRAAELIFHVEKDASILGTIEQPVTILGFCAGEIPGAIALAASDVHELTIILLEMVKILFRFWYRMNMRTIAVDDTDGNWGVTMMGTTQASIQAILDDFHDCEEIPYERRICIGVVSEGWITLVGCPTSMEMLLEWSDEIGELPRVDTFGRGSVHMQNLPKVDLESILGSSPLLDSAIGAKARMLSPYDCNYRRAATLRGLLGPILSDISLKPMYVSSAIRHVVKDIESEEATLVVAGYTAHSALVQKEMLEAGIDVYVAT